MILFIYFNSTGLVPKLKGPYSTGNDIKQTKPTAAQARPLNVEGLRSQGNAGEGTNNYLSRKQIHHLILDNLSGTWMGHTAKVTGNQDITVSTEEDAKHTMEPD